MKNNIKAFLCGILVTLIVCAAPVVAKEFPLLFNDIRINVDGNDQAQWGEDYTLADGSSAPYSIVYKDTTYLPMRKIAEMNGKAIYWNGDSNTAAMTAPQRENSQKVLAEKPDSYGNVWIYYTFTAEDDTSYLGIKDERRGYERIYRIAEGEADNIGVTENEIYFFRSVEQDGAEETYLCKIAFLNDINTQDGKAVDAPEDIAFDGEYVYMNYYVSIIGAHTVLYTYNIATGERYMHTYYYSKWGRVKNLKLKEKKEDGTTVLTCTLVTRVPKFHSEITFDRKTNTFSEPVKLYEVE